MASAKQLFFVGRGNSFCFHFRRGLFFFLSKLASSEKQNKPPGSVLLADPVGADSLGTVYTAAETRGSSFSQNGKEKKKNKALSNTE